jgi:hypothetical protein
MNAAHSLYKPLIQRSDSKGSIDRSYLRLIKLLLGGMN